jgi:hypothetical protein
MQRTNRVFWRGTGIFLTVLLLAAFVMSAAPTPVMAQAGPTATPTDPIWRAFDAARKAIEAERSVNLTMVQSYTFEQAQFEPGGIDVGCVTLEDPNEAREVYWGWVFNITDLRNQVYQARVSFDLKAVAVCEQVSTAAATPVPGGDTNLPAPVAGSAASGSFELGGHVLQLNANTVSLMQRAGMTWVKKQYRYNLGDGTGTIAGWVQDARSKGLKLLVGIVGQTGQMGDFDSYINTYAQFVGEVAALGVDAIEVWNEPNIDREWPTGQVNGANYTRLLAAAFNAIKSRRAETLVISGAPAPTGFFGEAGCNANGCNDDVFMQQMATAGAGQYLDFVGLHYNEGIVSPTANSGDPRNYYPTRYFSQMLSRGLAAFPGKQAVWTELGFLSGEDLGRPIPAGFAWAQNVTVAQHATWLAEAATLSAQSGRVRLMIVWNVDFPDMGGEDPMGGYAMFRRNGTCPACDTLGKVMGK